MMCNVGASLVKPETLPGVTDQQTKTDNQKIKDSFVKLMSSHSFSTREDGNAMATRRLHPIVAKANMNEV